MLFFLVVIGNHPDNFLFIGREQICDDSYNLQNQFPYPFGHREFHRSVDSLVKQSPYGVIGLKPLDVGKDVVLHQCQAYTRYLRREVPALAFPEPEQPFHFREADFNGPTHGVNLVGSKKSSRVSVERNAFHAPFRSLLQKKSRIFRLAYSASMQA